MVQDEIRHYIDRDAEQAFHEESNVFFHENRRLRVYLSGAVLTTLAFAGLFGYEAIKAGQRQVEVIGLEHGRQYILSSGGQPLSPKDLAVYDMVQQNLRIWAEDFYTRDKETIDSRWPESLLLMTNTAASKARSAADAYGGWKAGLLAGKVPETRAHVTSIVTEPVDMRVAPYRSTVHLTKIISGNDGEHTEKWLITVYYYIEPGTGKGIVPLFNGVGLYITQYEETPDYSS